MSPPNCGKRIPAQRRLIPCKSKRRRFASSAAGVVPSDVSSVEASWASLNEDIVRLIAGRVLAGDITDYLRFRAVCPQWRSSTECPRGRSVVDPRFHPHRWMMLPEGHGLYPGHSKLRGWVRFFNLATGAFACVRLPLFRDHFVMDSVSGLLLLHRDQDMAIRLLHPFTGDIVELPSLATLLPQVAMLFTSAQVAYMGERSLLSYIRSVCATVSFSPDGVITVMLALGPQIPRVAFATSEDQQWTLSSWEKEYMEGTIGFQGKLYTLSFGGFKGIFMIDPPQQEGKGSPTSSPPPPKLIATCPRDIILFRPVFLVECDSEILLVGHKDRSYSHVVVYRLADIILGRVMPLTSIGDSSLFIGDRRSLCVSSKAHPTIPGDSVVYVSPKKIDLAQYHLRSGTWSVAADGILRDGPIPAPYSLIHHIYACCHRYYWNKGHIFCEKAKLTWRAKLKWRYGG